VAASGWLIDVWTIENGMPNSSVTALAQTPEGYLWVGTHNGLVRFDGVRFTIFDPLNTPELKHARVFGLFVDPGGTLWINTYDGSLTSWRKGKFVHEWQAWTGFQIVQMFSRSNELVFTPWSGELVSREGALDSPGEWRRFKPDQPTTGFFYRRDPKGVLWYNTRDGAVGQVIGTNSQLLPSDCGLADQRVNCLETDRSGRIWAGTDKGIALWDGQRFQDHTPTNDEPQINVSFLFFTKDDSCWAVANNRLRRCRDRRWVFEAEGWGERFGTYAPAVKVSEDQEGGMWFCHFGQGIFHVNPEGTLHRITSADGLPGDRVSCWLQDQEGNVWVGVDRGGLVRLREKRFQVIGPAEGLTAAGAMSVCQDHSGAIWIGTYGGGLNRWQNGRLTSFTLAEGPTKGFFFSVYPDAQDRLWLSADREDPFVYETGRITRAPWDAHGIKATLVDRQGQLWLGTKMGLSGVRDGVLESFGPTSGFDYTGDIRALAQDARGDVWAGAGNGVLYCFHDGRFTAHRAEDKWGGQAIWSLLPDADGTMWVGTFRGGLLRFKDGGFTRYMTANGLPSDVICQILDDGAGRLWMGSHKGIFRMSKADLQAFARGETTSLSCAAYGTYDGLPSLECSGGYQPSAWRSRDGRLWFATSKGVVSIRPDQLPENRIPPQVVLEEFRVDGKPVSTDLSGDSPAPHLRIAPGRHYFEFRYTALCYTAPDKIRFRYKFGGVEDQWIEAGSQREVHYSQLPPGEYNFRVTACNNDGVWNEQGATLAFTVLPHFYETRWFLALAALLAAAAIAGAVRHLVVRRMRRELEMLDQRRAVERDRARIAQDIHDDLGAGLTRIMLESELARRDPPQEVQAHLGQITEMAHGLTRAIDEIVWAVDPQRDTLGALMDYATAYTEEFLQTAGIRCRIDLPAVIPPLHVEAETRYNLFLALKEALNNIVKHAQASEAWLRLRLDENGFTLVVEDNGRGLPESGTEGHGRRIVSGHGICNLEKRLLAAGGTCVIQSAPGKGTRVEMTVPRPAGGISLYGDRHRQSRQGTLGT
jgi:signal transduction histidine kinase/ligand-binding sensor domain-containing protein